jgi:hypothetical protein
MKVLRARRTVGSMRAIGRLSMLRNGDAELCNACGVRWWEIGYPGCAARAWATLLNRFAVGSWRGGETNGDCARLPTLIPGWEHGIM